MELLVEVLVGSDWFIYSLNCCPSIGGLRAAVPARIQRAKGSIPRLNNHARVSGLDSAWRHAWQAASLAYASLL
jgi:hypothetical protein